MFTEGDSPSAFPDLLLLTAARRCIGEELGLEIGIYDALELLAVLQVGDDGSAHLDGEIAARSRTRARQQDSTAKRTARRKIAIQYRAKFFIDLPNCWRG
jgi:hypothetical protein